MYKLVNDLKLNALACIIRTNADGSTTSFGQDPANTDYANFKRDIEDGAELQDADGNVMTADAAKEFIKTLP